MPPLTSHYRFAALVMPRLGIASGAGSFLLGTTAPDAFDPDRAALFFQYHFIEKDQLISLERFRRETAYSFQPAGSFACGYYCHLWLDVYFQANADRLSFRRPQGMSDADLRSLVRREAEIPNAPFVLQVAESTILQPAEVALPAALEFVDLQRCADLFHAAVQQAQAETQPAPPIESRIEPAYTQLFEDALESFLNEIQSAGG